MPVAPTSTRLPAGLAVVHAHTDFISMHRAHGTQTALLMEATV